MSVVSAKEAEASTPKRWQRSLTELLLHFMWFPYIALRCDPFISSRPIDMKHLLWVSPLLGHVDYRVDYQCELNVNPEATDFII